MALNIHLYQLRKEAVLLEGELTVEEMELESRDELIEMRSALRYRLSAELFDQNILVQGELRITLECGCARCLNAFEHEVALPEWFCHIPLTGEDKVELKGDAVDLIPFIREETLLAFPRHPVCRADCEPLPYNPGLQPKAPSLRDETGTGHSVWAELEKLNQLDLPTSNQAD